MTTQERTTAGLGLCILVAAVVVVVTVKVGYDLQSMDVTDGATAFGDSGGPSPGDPAPDFELRDLNGNPVRLTDYEGQVVLLDFWATWCGPCIREMPVFIALDEQYADDELKLIGIAVMDTEAKVRSYATEEEIGFALAMGGDEVRQAYGGVNAIPQTFLIDRKGTVRYVQRGSPADLLVFQQRIEELLAE